MYYEVDNDFTMYNFSESEKLLVRAFWKKLADSDILRKKLAHMTAERKDI